MALMLRLAANLSFLYQELAFAERFAAAAADGFEGVEFLFPYAHEPEDLRSLLHEHQLQQVLFNAPPGNWEAGERGLACLPGRESEFREGVMEALRWARALQCPRVHVMAGCVPEGLSRKEAQARYVSNLQWAAQQAAATGVTLLMEPINTVDMPGYFLNRQDHAHALLEAIGRPQVKLQLDLYHAHIMEGDGAPHIRQWLPTGRVEHFQIAGVPGRHEPVQGELNGASLLHLIDEVAATCGWRGWVGCEYRPAAGAVPGGTRSGLGWAQPWLIRNESPGAA